VVLRKIEAARVFSAVWGNREWAVVLEKPWCRWIILDFFAFYCCSLKFALVKGSGFGVVKPARL
jgi:hypothetical protein